MRSPTSDRGRHRLRTFLTILATALVVAPATALASHGFDDVDDSAFYHAAVDWMKDNGVTVGCNPPGNTRYCPDDPVTRGEMAVFLERLDSEDVFLRPDEGSTAFSGRLFAVVGSDGTLDRSNNVESAARISAGGYEVIFNQDVTGCAYIASTGNVEDATPENGHAVVAKRGGQADGVYVATYDSGDTKTDRAFHLWVAC